MRFCSRRFDSRFRQFFFEFFGSFWSFEYFDNRRFQINLCYSLYHLVFLFSAIWKIFVRKECGRKFWSEKNNENGSINKFISSFTKKKADSNKNKIWTIQSFKWLWYDTKKCEKQKLKLQCVHRMKKLSEQSIEEHGPPSRGNKISLTDENFPGESARKPAIYQAKWPIGTNFSDENWSWIKECIFMILSRISKLISISSSATRL